LILNYFEKVYPARYVVMFKKYLKNIFNLFIVMFKINYFEKAYPVRYFIMFKNYYFDEAYPPVML